MASIDQESQRRRSLFKNTVKAITQARV